MSRGWVTVRLAETVSTRTRVVEHPEAALGEAVPLAGGRNDPEAHQGQRHHGEQPVELPGHDVGVPDRRPQDLLLDDGAELPAAGVQHALAVRAGLDGGGGVVPEPHARRPEQEDRGGVLGGGEQAGHDRGVVDAEQRGLLVSRDRRFRQVLQPGLHLPPVLVVHRLDVAGGRDQVRDLVGRPARGAPGADVVLGRAPRPVLDLADQRVVQARGGRQRPPGELSVLAYLAQTSVTAAIMQ